MDAAKYKKLRSEQEQQELTFQRALKELQKSRDKERENNRQLREELTRVKSCREDITRLGEQLLDANKRVEEADIERERAVSVATQLQNTYDELAEKYKSERIGY